MTDRLANGRFPPGASGNPNGRPKRDLEKEREYLEILRSVVSAADWKAIVAKAVEQSKRGHPMARKWLSDYLVGEPDKNVSMSGGLTIEVVYVNNTATDTASAA